MSTSIFCVSGDEAVIVAKALASEPRTRILDLVAESPMTVNQIAAALGIAQPAASNHIRILEQAGLLVTQIGSGEHGATKLCRRAYTEVHLRFDQSSAPSTPYATTLSLPVGAYSRFEAHPTCGLSSSSSLIGLLDDPRAFYLPERWQADILWFGWGFVEYEFANPIFKGQQVERLDCRMELCSEAPHYREDYPSEITFSFNEITVGAWICPGDMGVQRGWLNPAWWSPDNTQYGFLKTLTIDASGTYLDGLRLSDITLDDLSLHNHPAVKLRLAVHEDAEFCGGLTLFGKSFGNYPQDIDLTITLSGGK